MGNGGSYLNNLILKKEYIIHENSGDEFGAFGTDNSDRSFWSPARRISDLPAFLMEPNSSSESNGETAPEVSNIGFTREKVSVHLMRI